MNRMIKLLSVSDKIKTGDSLTETERTLFMEGIKQEILTTLQTKYSAQLTEPQLQYLERDRWFYSHPEIAQFIEAVKKCVEFAKVGKFKLGPGRGSAPASISLFGLGFSGVDPMKYKMIPERLTTQAPNVHIDVEFERGQEFVDFCKEINKTLSFGEIQAFRMPLIDIVQNVHKQLGSQINFDLIDENSEAVLAPFRSVEIERIFQFDFSEKALVMKYENFLPEFSGLEKMKSYLSSQKIHHFRDITNITALWRPFNEAMVSRIQQYSDIKSQSPSPSPYPFLAKEIQKTLAENFGMVLYHEDLLRIISFYTKWDLARSNSFRKFCADRSGQRLNLNSNPNRELTDAEKADWAEFNEVVPDNVKELVFEESKWAFCLPHAIAFAQFTKQTAVLKSLHKEIYYSEIEKFEQKHGFTWDDIGIRIKGVSLLQD